jgi:hypothetical protein
MKEQTITTYIANDGKPFNDAAACALYEAGLEHAAVVDAYLNDRYGEKPVDRGLQMRKTTSRSILIEWEAERNEFLARMDAGEFDVAEEAASE